MNNEYFTTHPKRGDIVTCNVPYEEKPLVPGPRTRPCVVLDRAFDPDIGRWTLTVAPATTARGRRPWLINITPWRNPATLQLEEGKKQFVTTDKIFVLPLSRQFFYCRHSGDKIWVRIIDSLPEEPLREIDEKRKRWCPTPLDAAVKRYKWVRGIRTTSITSRPLVPWNEIVPGRPKPPEEPSPGRDRLEIP